MSATTTRKRKALSLRPLAPLPSAVSKRKGMLSYGMLNMPVEMYPGTEKIEPGRKWYQRVTVEAPVKGRKKAATRTVYQSVGTQTYNTVTGQLVPRSEVVECVERDGNLIPISNDDLASLGGKRGVFPILGFVEEDTIGGRWLVSDGIYQMRVQPKFPSAERVFNGLLELLREKKAVALLTFCLADGKPTRYGLLDGHGRVSAVHCMEGLRQEIPLPETPPLSLPERRALEQIYRGGLFREVPELHHDLQKLEDLITSRLTHPETSAIVKEEKEPVVEDIPDLLALLQATLDQRK